MEESSFSDFSKLMLTLLDFGSFSVFFYFFFLYYLGRGMCVDSFFTKMMEETREKEKHASKVGSYCGSGFHIDKIRSFRGGERRRS